MSDMFGAYEEKVWELYQKTRDERDELLKELQSLCNYSNGVTAFHRHGSKIPEDKLNDLSNKQIVSELLLDKIKAGL